MQRRKLIHVIQRAMSTTTFLSLFDIYIYLLILSLSSFSFFPLHFLLHAGVCVGIRSFLFQAFR